MGATVHLHYCMDEFVGWSLIENNDGKCGKCGMTEKGKQGCCKDEQQHFKLKADHQKTIVEQSVNPVIAPALFAHVINFIFQPALNSTENYPTSHAPPDIYKERLHVLHCIFLI